MKRYTRAAVFLSFGLFYSTTAFCFSAVWSNWLNAVDKRLGYNVAQGSAHVFELSDCAADIQIFGSCGGNNPAAPYIEIQPPVSNGSANEFVDPCYTINGNCSQNKGSFINTFTHPLTGSSTDYVNQYYRLGSNDAIVVVVSMPPLAAYLGYQSYVFSRAVNQYSPLPILCVPVGGLDTCRTPVLGSIGNSINNVTLKSRSSALTFTQPSNTASVPAEAVFISTPNQTLYNDLRKAFLNAGGTSSQIFVEPFYSSNDYSSTPPVIIGSSYSKKNVIPGFDTNDMTPAQAVSDEFNTLMRYAVFADSTASRRWLCAINQDSGNLSTDCSNLAPLPPSPIAVYRITKPTRRWEYQKFYGKSTLAARGSNSDEHNLGGVDYGTVASDLASAVGAYMKQQLSESLGIKQANPANNVGPRCLTYNLPCYEDTQDTAPYGTLNAGTLNDNYGNIAFLVGVNHAGKAVNNATYLSVGVYDAGSLQLQNFDIGLLEGIASLSQTNATATGFDSCANVSTDPTKSNCLNGSALQVWKDIGQPAGDHGSLNATTVANLYVATIARDTYCAAGGAGAGLPFCSSAYVTAGYTILPITPPSGMTNYTCDAVNDPHCGKYLPIPDLMGLSERAYIVPGLSNGADPNMIVYPYLVH
jgi:hypothetical protein